MHKRALVIEDDHDIATLVAINLRELDCTTDIVANGIDGLNYALAYLYDVIVLDVMLPKMDGIEVCRRIRAENNTTPIIMLTARAEESDKIRALDIGADDYITKPFSVRELVARVKARIRRFSPEKEASFINAKARHLYGDLMLDTDLRKTTLGGKTIDLTAKEFDLLSLFIRNPGRAYTRAELLDLVWGFSYSGYEHTVNSHINRLRMKIEKDAASPLYILTVWGIGYKFNDEL
ncbi:MAG: response regulator transcription factor [Rhizobacter sp.]|nr:response regulator transcription factor [Chlorobiales bacterium]